MNNLTIQLMKKILLLALSMVLCIGGFAQETKGNDSKSKTVEFLKKDGALLKKEFFDIGNISYGNTIIVKFQNILITDVVSKSKVGALRLEIEYTSSMLDSDELEACIQSVKYLRDNVINQRATTHTECEYRSRDGVLIGVHSNLRNPEKPWTFYVQAESYTSSSRETLSLDKIDELISLLEKAQAQLKECGV